MARLALRAHAGHRPPSHCRRRRWIALVTVLAFLSLTSAALAHHHKSERSELLCPICRAVGPNQLAVPTPDLSPVTVSVVAVLIPPDTHARLLPLSKSPASPHIRGPPRSPSPSSV